jgi:hypothetical protein
VAAVGSQSLVLSPVTSGYKTKLSYVQHGILKLCTAFRAGVERMKNRFRVVHAFIVHRIEISRIGGGGDVGADSSLWVVAGCCEHGSGSSGTVNGGKYLVQLCQY